jgi:hypothetical protein
VTANRHGTSVVEYPSELEIVTTREFDAPLDLVFDVLSSPSTCAAGSLRSPRA